ncbi:hypothetical protein TNCV_4403591 [Trichonephila clavipes]|uniref:Uncharacterized protein n=1 Tax=Trichonephila clavipes TaxID=2585209 RepID=A0A8X6V5L1_TRICX|nr:hypothetical protein TNCV_4403591 [Trichonephila clavipes]
MVIVEVLWSALPLSSREFNPIATRRKGRNRYTTPSSVSRWIDERTRYLLWQACVACELLCQVSVETLDAVSSGSDDFGCCVK